MSKEKELLFSITERDFVWSYSRGSGKGGQKRNKTESAVHCKHPPSNALGYSDETRSQHKNKRIAFEKCIATKEFKAWHKIEIAKHMGTHQIMVDKVEDMIRPKNLKVEIFKDGRWNSEESLLSISDSEEQNTGNL